MSPQNKDLQTLYWMNILNLSPVIIGDYFKDESHILNPIKRRKK